MSIDLVKAYVDAKGKYITARGGSPASGKWSPPSNVVPNTTVADIDIMTTKFQGLYDAAKELFPRTLNSETTGRVVAAYNTWRLSTPSGKYFFGWGKPDAGTIYPYNDEFWGTAGQMLLTASAAGVVPGQWDIAVESVKEAVKEAAEKVAGIGLGTTKLIVYGVVGYFVYDAFLRRKS